jgi:hypothetical protein
VERVDLHLDPAGGQQEAAFVAPVNLGLRPSDDLEPPVQPRRPTLPVGLDLESPPGLADIDLDPLVVPGEPILGHQPLIDHRGPQPRVRGQPRVDHPDERVHLPRHPPGPRGCPRRGRRRLPGQVLPRGAPVTARRRADLFPRRPGRAQRGVPPDVHPCLHRQDHGRPPQLINWSDAPDQRQISSYLPRHQSPLRGHRSAPRSRSWPLAPLIGRNHLPPSSGLLPRGRGPSAS